jgi:hypothetical protein
MPETLTARAEPRIKPSAYHKTRTLADELEWELAGNEPRFNEETKAALLEARDISSGKILSKTYFSARELFAELDEEYEAEEAAKCLN